MKISAFKALIAASVAITSLAVPAKAGFYEEDKNSAGPYAVIGIGTQNNQQQDWEDALNVDKGGEVKTDAGFAYQVGIGYDFGVLRTDFTYDSSSPDLSSCTETKTSSSTCVTSGDLSTHSLMLNAYIDFGDEASRLTPYIGAGVGTTTIDYDTLQVASTNITIDDQTAFTYQLKAGVNYALNSSSAIYLEGAYRKFQDTISETNTNGEKIQFSNLSALTAVIGYRYNF